MFRGCVTITVESNYLVLHYLELKVNPLEICMAVHGPHKVFEPARRHLLYCLSLNCLDLDSPQQEITDHRVYLGSYRCGPLSILSYPSKKIMQSIKCGKRFMQAFKERKKNERRPQNLL
jgi:hypothetical protein